MAFKNILLNAQNHAIQGSTLRGVALQGEFILKVRSGVSLDYCGKVTTGEPLKVLSVTSVQQRPCPSSSANCTHPYSHLKPILHEITVTPGLKDGQFGE